MNTISRRSVAKGAAWAIPVIAVGAPVSAVAASGPGTVTFNGTGCKEPGKSQTDDWGYKCDLTVTAPVGSDVEFIRVDAPNEPNAKVISGKTLVTTSASQYHQVIISASNSANGTATLFYSINGTVGNVQVVLDGFKPCKK